jgi:hypothetical protein
VESDRKEAYMAWAFIQDSPEASLDDYDRVTAELGSVDPDGLILHVAGESPGGGLRIIDVWESKEHYERFRDELLVPAFERAIGAQGPTQPQEEELNVHNLVRGL